MYWILFGQGTYMYSVPLVIQTPMFLNSDNDKCSDKWIIRITEAHMYIYTYTGYIYIYRVHLHIRDTLTELHWNTL